MELGLRNRVAIVCAASQELANVIVFLGSERASYISGTTVNVDGGFMKGII